jgi:methylmalonyl-CoA mutase
MSQLDGEVAWREMALAVLRKSGRAAPEDTAADVDRLLTTTTDDGVAIRPLYLDGPPAPALAPREPAAGWDVRQPHDASDPGSLSDAIAEDLAGGVTSIWLTVRDEPGLPVVAACSAYPAALILDAGAHTAAAAEIFLEATPVPRGNLGADPLGLSARTGEAPNLDELPGLAGRCVAEHAGRLRAITVDATVYHEAGGGDAEELACALATALAYLRLLTDVGLSLPAAFDQIDFRYAVGSDQFVSVAKLRAARLLWARIAEASGAAPARQRQHAVTSWAMTTNRAPWNNIARSTVAAFAAVIGGADALTVLPFDTSAGRPTPEARRLARNTQAVLQVEAHAARVHDPGAGSWYLEHLTRDLAGAAWDWFRKIEGNGGLAVSLTDGLIEDRLAATRERRQDDLRHRRRTVVGTTHFTRPDENRPDENRPDENRPDENRGQAGHGLPRSRYAEEYQRLQDRASIDGLPAVPLLLLESRAGADAAFAEQFLAAGGLRTVRHPGATPAPVVCLCGTGESARSAVASLREAGVRRMWAVGEPVPGLGVDGHFAAGCDAVAVLDAILDDLGAPR